MLLRDRDGSTPELAAPNLSQAPVTVEVTLYNPSFLGPYVCPGLAEFYADLIIGPISFISLVF